MLLFDENGDLSVKNTYLLGKMNGLSTYYNKKGVVLKQSMFVAGKLNGYGPTIENYESGKIRRDQYSYKDDKLEGEWVPLLRKRFCPGTPVL